MPRSEYKLDHVACGVRSIADCIDYVEGVLGADPHEIGPGAEFRYAQLQFAGGGRLELLEPTAPVGGFMDRFVDSHGPGVHHVTFKVPSLAAAADAARAAGYDVVGYNDSHPAWQEAFLHPKQAQGLVVQFAQVDPSLSDWQPNPQDFPAVVEDRPAALEFRGLCVSARSEADALAQWSKLLGGEVTQEGSRLAFCWKDSPLRVWVVVDPARRPGPLALWFCGRAAELGPQPHPLLGVSIERTQ